MRGSATRIILIAASILVLILMIAATHHPRTQVCVPAYTSACPKAASVVACQLVPRTPQSGQGKLCSYLESALLCSAS